MQACTAVQRVQVEETLNRIKTHKGVSGHLESRGAECAKCAECADLGGFCLMLQHVQHVQHVQQSLRGIVIVNSEGVPMRSTYGALETPLAICR